MELDIEEKVDINIGDRSLEGNLNIPDNPRGLVIFSHGAGSSRLSPRNRNVAEQLNKNGYGTLLFDLLTNQEDQIYANRFDIELLTKRLMSATKWVREQDRISDLDIAFFGASTGAASALKATARLEQGDVKTVISRGGRPDLAIGELDKVKCPVLLIIGGLDTPVIDMNHSAAEDLENHHIEIVPGATHLFEEPGKLEEVAGHVNKWLDKHM
ncbi:MAG: dienelactone hydrolase family protein [Candidatus Cyclobacteriaceae bacterium M2_1C_046]